MIYYQVYVNGQWCADFDSWEEAYSYINGHQLQNAEILKSEA